MPWQSLELPPLPVGILAATIRSARPDDHVSVRHANISFVEFLHERTGGALTPDEYGDVVEHGLFHGLGDWVFTSALYPDASWPEERYAAYRRSRHVHDGPARLMRELAPEFIELTATEILADGPDVVGLSTTFMQNVPCLALATALKRCEPSVVVVLGGGNCDGPMGAALHRAFPVLDYVVSGEGEQALLALLQALDAGAGRDSLASVPGLCWRDGERSVANPPASEPLDMDAVPTPRFDDWFEAVEGGLVREYVEPKLILEAARGCWWGMRKHCTFCGLNGSNMTFRSKPPQRVFSEIGDYVTRHQVLDVVMVDNIMDMGYISTLLPDLAATGWDLRLHYEVKSNLKRDHVRAMADAGVVHIQPGIESLSTRVLNIMAKGVDGVTNVRLLRDCEDLRVTTPWNYLYGFPGEEAEDYRSIIDQMPNLYHLQPPRIATRITVERFSPYHNDPGLGFAVRKPAAFYRHIYDLPAAQLIDLVYLFDSPAAGIEGEDEEALQRAVAAWQEAYVASTLRAERDGDALVITDRRVGREQAVHVLREPWQVRGYELLADGLGIESLLGRLVDEGFDVEREQLGSWSSWLLDQGLVFHDAGRFVAVATSDVPARVPVARWR